jgi:hypothetical protein
MASTSRTSSCRGGRRARAALVAGALVLAACSGGASELARLAKADGPVERAAGDDPWRPAPIGTGFRRGDAARTAAGAAELEVTGGARLAMQPHTILRFGGKARAGDRRMVVETGAVEIIGAGSYALDVGDVTVASGGTVRVTSRGDGRRAIELEVGEAQISIADGAPVALEVGRAVELGIGAVVVTINPDAAVPDAPAPDAAAPEPAAGPESAAAEIELAGAVEVQRPGEAGWKALPPDTRRLEKGTKLRLARGASAKLASRGVSLQLGGGARVAIEDDLALSLEAGGGRATATEGGVVRLPGGALALRPGPAGGPAEARIDAGARETAIAIARGAGQLSGAPGTDLAMSRGESAVLGRAGTIRVVEAIPAAFDLRVAAGEVLTVHDPRPGPAVQFVFGGKCPEGGIVELDRDGRFRTPRVSAGKDAANLRVEQGAWSYRVRCTTGRGEGGAVASGRIAVIRDSGTRALPRARPPNDIDADGRTWRISYQSLIPDLRVHAPGAPPGRGAAYRLSLSRGGKTEVIASTSPSIAVPGGSLREGTYSYWIEADGAMQGKISTLIINFDQTAAQVYIESPQDGAPWTGDLDVRGAVLPGWTATVDTVEIPIDRQRRFAARVGAPSAGALAIKLSHPERGIHYYLRRRK